MGATVRKKGNDWYVYMRQHGECHAKKCDSEAKAIALAAAIRDKIILGEFNISAWKKPHQEPKEEKPQAPTLEEFFKKTMSPFWESSLAPGTFSRYELSFRLHIQPVLGAVRMNELTRDQVKDLIVSLLQKNATKRTENEEDRKLSKDSIRNVVATLRAMLQEAEERKLIVVNPATKLGKYYREASTVREQIDPFTKEEIPVLLESTREHFGLDNYVILLTLFHTGLRASELAGLQWNDIDFRDRFITVRRQYKNGKTTRTKTKKIRKIDLSDVLLKELQALKKRRQEQYLAKGKNEIPEWIFLSPGKIIWSDGTEKRGGREPIGHKEGQPLDMKNLRNRVFLRDCDKANIRRRRVHDTRHSFASILLMAGESPAYVKEQLGHSSIKMTVDIYGHWIPGSNRQAVNKLPSLSTAKAHTKTASD
jgi:integrase